MENLGQMIMEIPPISRIWTISIITTTICTSIKLINPLRLIFVPQLIFTQPWRLFTGFCYFGELSFPVILAIWSTIRWSRSIEESYNVPITLMPHRINSFDEIQLSYLHLKMNLLKPLDYFYMIILISISIIITVSLSDYYLNFKLHKLCFLGLILNEVLTFISCKLNPNQQVNVLGFFTFTGSNIPLFTTLLDLLLNNEFRFNLIMILKGEYSRLPFIIMSEPFCRAMICLFLGQFWWFMSFYLFQNFLNDGNSQRFNLRNKTVKRFEQLQSIQNWKFDIFILKVILLPPWYWVIILNIINNRGPFRLYQQRRNVQNQ